MENISFIFLYSRPLVATCEKNIGVMYKTRFLADQLQFAIHYEQNDDLRYKLSEFLIECLNITNRYSQILNCPTKTDMFFLGGKIIKSQITTLAEMLVQNVNHIKNKVMKVSAYSNEKSLQVLWQMLIKINKKLASYLDKVNYWIY